jgi:hypothetical protein
VLASQKFLFIFSTLRFVWAVSSEGCLFSVGV